MNIDQKLELIKVFFTPKSQVSDKDFPEYALKQREKILKGNKSTKSGKSGKKGA